MSSRPCAACTRTSRDDPLILKSASRTDRARRSALSVVLIAAVLWQADLHRIGNALRDTSPGWFGAAIAHQHRRDGRHGRCAGTCCCSRAGAASPASGGSSRRTRSRSCSGQILPTAVGGDAVRAIDLARRTGARAEAVSSVLVDRVVGLAALGALAAGGALAGGTGIGRGTAIALGLGVVAATALAAVALFSLRLPPAAAPARAARAPAARRGAAARALPRAARLSRASGRARPRLRARRLRPGHARRLDLVPRPGHGSRPRLRDAARALPRALPGHDRARLAQRHRPARGHVRRRAARRRRRSARTRSRSASRSSRSACSRARSAGWRSCAARSAAQAAAGLAGRVQ